jgi:hypothetical protein
MPTIPQPETIAGTDLYLGVVHAADGIEGAKKRLAAAGKHVRVSGIATECGMARAKTPDVVIRLLEIHANASFQAPCRQFRSSTQAVPGG